MEFPTTYNTFTIPSGATTGHRIVINEDNSGTIRVYDDNNILVDEIGGTDGHITQFTNGGRGLTIVDGEIDFFTGNPGAKAMIYAPGNELVFTTGYPGGGASDEAATLMGFPGESFIPGFNGQPIFIFWNDVSGGVPANQPTNVGLTGSLVKYDGDAFTPNLPQLASFNAGWASGSSVGSYAPLQFWVDGQDCLVLYGCFQVTSAAPSTPIFTMGVNFRPNQGSRIPVTAFDNSGSGNPINGVHLIMSTSGAVSLRATALPPVGSNLFLNSRIPLGNL